MQCVVNKMAAHNYGRLRRAIKEALLVLNANKEEDWDGGHFKEGDDVCEGCQYELDEAIRILRKAIDLPVRRTACPRCDKWMIPSLYRGETPPKDKSWRCSECKEWLSADEIVYVTARKGERKGWNG